MEGDDQITYVVPLTQVRRSVDVLLARDTHPFFIAYLWLRREAGRRGSTRNLQPDWSELGRYLEVDGGPPGKPYLRPFWVGLRNAHQEWLNANLRGSFAPSSIRGTPRQVIETTAGGRYQLREGHWERALEHLLLGVPLPAFAVAGFLLRDRGFVSDVTPPPGDLIRLFREEFGYRQQDDEEFYALFETSWGADDPPVWFEPFVPAEVQQ